MAGERGSPHDGAGPGLAAAGGELTLTMGPRRQTTVADAGGTVGYARLDLADIEPLSFALR